MAAGEKQKGLAAENGKCAKNGLQLERDVLVESDFPSEMSGRGEMLRNGKGEGGMLRERNDTRRD